VSCGHGMCRSAAACFISGVCLDTGKLFSGAEALTRCKASRDGECSHAGCPQLRDNEPKATGRHCPLDTDPEEA
jgi:hypothetical protein